MTGDAHNWTLANAACDAVVAASCFCIAASFAIFSARNRHARLGRAFAVFALLFAFGGLTHVCEVAGWLRPAVAFKSVTALACAAGAYLSVKCLPAARTMFARAASIERETTKRLARLRTDPRYDTPEDRVWQATLSDIQDLARLAREVVQPEEV